MEENLEGRERETWEGEKGLDGDDP